MSKLNWVSTYWFQRSFKMSGKYSVQSFQQRAQVTREKLDFLRNHLSNLKENLVIQEEERLKQENQLLQNRVSFLKQSLEETELANGSESLPNPVCNGVQKEFPPSMPKVTEVAAANSTKGKTKKAAKPNETKPKKVQKPQEGGAPVDVSRLDFRVAQIMTVKRHPDADSLYVEEIQTGEENLRTVVTGLVNHVPIEQMENRKVVLMCNLKPAKMRGILSQAMVMCANSPDKVEIIDPPPSSVPGDRIVFEGYPGKPDPQLNPKKKVWEKVQPDLLTNDDCVACYKGVAFTVEGKGVCKVQTLANCGIK